MATKRSTHLDDPPSASSDDDETEDEQEPQIITQKPIQQSSSSSSDEEEQQDDEQEEESNSESESEEETPQPLKTPKIQNPSSKSSSSEEEEEELESESEEETPIKASIEKPKILTPNPSSVFEFESDIKSPSASDFAIKPSKKLNFSETSESTPTLKRHSIVSDLKDKKKIKVSNGDIDDEKKSVIKRVWSDEDELQLLQGFIDYQFSKKFSPLSDMDGFYQFTMDTLPGNASKSQLYEKIRRLKKKFRVNEEKASKNGGEDPIFVKPHERKLFEISKKIWGVDGCETVGNVGGSSASKAKVRSSKVNKPKVEVKEEVKDDVKMDKVEDFETLYPYWNAGLNSEVSSSLKFPAGVVSLIKEHMSLIGEVKAKEMDEKWEALFDDEAVLRKRRIALLSNIGK